MIAPGAAKVQLLSTSPNAYPVSKVTATRKGGVAVVAVVNANDAAAFRLVRRDAAGHKIGDGVPAPEPRPARPLGDGGQAGHMTVTVEQDFRDFVVARWGELEPLAHLVTLDGPSARRVTTDALADLHGQWGRLLDEGSPGAATHRAVLAGSLRGGRTARRPRPRRPLGRAATTPAPRATRTRHPTTWRVTALLPVLRRAAPLERAVLGAATAWGLDAGRVADLLEMPVQQLADADASVRRRLLAAHTAARTAAGWEAAPWALDRDLDDALDLLMAGPGDPPDAVALVGERHRQVHRRSVVLGAGAALAAAAATAWGAQSVLTGVSSEAAPQPPGPGDPAWAMTGSWPARGRLASDPGVTALVAGASPRAHLLYADDVAGRRVVVAATADTSGQGGTLVRMWAGPRGARADGARPAPTWCATG